MMGPELQALHGGISASLLAVTGGRLSSVFADSDLLGVLMALLRNMTNDPSDADRLMQVAQSILDAGDPAVWARYALAERLDDHAPPATLLTMALFDEIVPTSATLALARALGTPVLEPVLVEPGLVPSAAPPLSGNLEGLTVGLFQFDRTRSKESAEVEEATHIGTPTSYEHAHLVQHFFKTWREGAPEIIDPLATLSTPPLD
jgi:hypothetical protein